MSKLVKIDDAVAIIEDGMTVAIGGNVLHRAPHRFIYAVIRKGKKNLDIIKTAGAHDVDILCFSGAVKSVAAGFISYETEYGLCTNYRKSVESGDVKANEHACYTVIAGIRAAIQGVPFMPFRGLDGSDLHEREYFNMVKDPFGGGDIPVVKAIVPDVAIIHVHEADEKGNAIIKGPVYEDLLFAKAAKKLIITAERIISNEEIRKNKISTIPGFLVDKVVEMPNGASPGSCAELYDIDRVILDEFKLLKTKCELDDYLKKY